MSRKEEAMKYFRSGYNCAQSVVLAFSDLLVPDYISEEALLRSAVPFGGGIGRLREVCGAVSGAVIVLGQLYGYTTAETGELKRTLYARIQELGGHFEEQNGSLVCRTLLGLDEKHSEPQPEQRSDSYYRNRPCERLIGSAAEILDEYIRTHPY